MGGAEKDLGKFSHKERERILRVVRKITANNIAGLRVEKLKGVSDVYRVRVGDLRIIYQKVRKTIIFLRFSRRNEKTYDKL